jgi:uncharacterized protein GlcG (DUF336 family)
VNEEFIRRERIALSGKGSHVLVHAAEKKAQTMGIGFCIAVVDAAGELVAFSRMDDARPGSIEIAISKARSAARRRRATADEAGGDVSASIRLALASHLNVTGIGGGLPIAVGDQVIGAIGVSSGSTEEDLMVAQAGLDAFLAG